MNRHPDSCTIFGALMAVAAMMAFPATGWGGTGEIWRDSQYGWTSFKSQPFSARAAHTTVWFHDKLWVIGGMDNAGRYLNDVWYSSDGATWIQAAGSAPFTPRRQHTSVVFDNKIWVIGGCDAGGLSNDVWYSPDGASWFQSPAAPFAARWYHTSIVFSGKLWVIGGNGAGGNLNDVWYSSDGLAWTQAPATTVFSPRWGHTNIVFNSQIWVIGGQDSDGSPLNDVWRSGDGRAWTRATASAAFTARTEHTSLIFNNRMWVIGGSAGGNEVWSSADGAAWAQAEAPAAFPARYGHTSAAFNNRIWVLGGQGTESSLGDVWHSADGAAWTLCEAGFFKRSEHSSVVFNDKMWVIAGLGKDIHDYKNDVWSSSDGVSWTKVTASAAFSARRYHNCVAFNNQLYLIGGANDSGRLNDVWRSSDGATWTSVTTSAAFSKRYGQTSVVFGGKIWIIGGYDGASYLNDAWYSSDGATWTQAPATAPFPARLTHKSVVFDDGSGDKMWVIGGLDAAGRRNDVWSSSDGATWTCATPSAEFSPRYWHTCSVYDNQMWVIGGSDSYMVFNNDVWHSSNGVTWTQASAAAGFSGRYELASLAFNGKLWVLAGWDGMDCRNDAWYSTNGAAWTQTWGTAAFSYCKAHASAVFNNQMWVTGGWDENDLCRNDVWRSSDGAAWIRSSAPFAARVEHASESFNGALWVIGGMDDVGLLHDVWRTSDGLSWALASGAPAFSARRFHTSVAFAGKLWVIGGLDAGGCKNDVWKSSDGVSWTSATLSAAFTPRYGHASAAFNNRIWVLGGYDTVTGYVNDVWSSEDGVTWTQTPVTSGFPARFKPACVVLNDAAGGKMWIIGGVDGGSRRNDIWYSADGARWTCATSSAAFAPRYQHTSLAFGGKLWTIGGFDSGSAMYNDVWQSGNGAAAAIAPSSVDFGTQDAAAPQPPSTVTLSNLYPQGWAPIYITTAAIQNDVTGAFALATVATTEALLAGEGRGYGIVFAPKINGLATANLTIQSSDPTSPVIAIPLSGYGVIARPSNDAFASATAIAQISGAASGGNNLATKEIGEPYHAGDAGGASVWWKWTAPETGSYAFNTHGSSFNTLLAIYFGNGVSALTAVAANDNDGSANGASGLVFSAQAGVQYRIAVDGYDGAAGSIALNWTIRRGLTVASWAPNSGVAIGISPLDADGLGAGATQFTRTYDNNTTVTLTAPLAAPDGSWFYRWLVDGHDFAGNTQRAVAIWMNASRAMTAVYYSNTPTLAVASQNPGAGVGISIYPTDLGGRTNGVTPFDRQYLRTSLVTLTAPAIAPNGTVFSQWLKDGQNFANISERAVLCSIDTNHTMTAVYTHPANTSLLTVASTATAGGVVVAVYPADKYNRTTGTTQFVYPYAPWSLVTLTAPAVAPNGYVFQKWLKDGADFANNTGRAALCSMGADHAMMAVYVHPSNTRLLTVASSNPDSGVAIAIYPTDINGRNSGATQFVSSYAPNVLATLTAPASAPNGNRFVKWLRDGQDFSNNAQPAVVCPMNADRGMTAIYVPAP